MRILNKEKVFEILNEIAKKTGVSEEEVRAIIDSEEEVRAIIDSEMEKLSVKPVNVSRVSELLSNNLGVI